MRWADQQADSANSLSEARRLQDAAAKQGFDWTEIGPLWDKLSEEIAELKVAVEEGESDAIQDELGDLFFMLVNFSRFLQVSPQAALHGTNEKFIRRLKYVEARLQEQGKAWPDASLEEMEAHWQAAKTAASKTREI